MSAATKTPASVGLKGALDDAGSTHGEEHAGKQFLCDCWRVKKEGRKKRKGKEKETKRRLPQATQAFLLLLGKTNKTAGLIDGTVPCSRHTTELCPDKTDKHAALAGVLRKMWKLRNIKVKAAIPVAGSMLSPAGAAHLAGRPGFAWVGENTAIQILSLWP